MIVSGGCLKWPTFDNDIELMLPANPEVSRMLRFLEESTQAGKVILSLGLTSDQHTTADLLAAADDFTESFDSPLVSGVVSGIGWEDLSAETRAFLRYTPQLVGAETLAEIDMRLTPEGITEILEQHYRQLLSPASSFVAPYIRSDPLGIQQGVLLRLERIVSTQAYDVRLEGGHFVSRDGLHALIVVDTPIPVTDGFGARALLGYLDEQASRLPSYISMDIIAGHRHTLSNEDVITRDVQVALSAAAIGFLFLFVVVLKDVRAVLVFLLPTAAVFIATIISSAVLSSLSYLVLGLGGVVAGIAVDYGIHVYLAVRTGQSPAGAVQQIRHPVLLGALTTAMAFAAFSVSNVPGYRQLALLAVLSIGLCVAGALFVLPRLLGYTSKPVAPVSWPPWRYDRWMPGDRALVLLWTLFVAASAVSATRMSFATDLRMLDGSEASVFAAEERFNEVWGGEAEPAVLVVGGESLEEVLQANELMYRQAVAITGSENVLSLAEIWPSRATRLANASAWTEFWSADRVDTVGTLLVERGRPLHFAAGAFVPFLEGLGDVPDVTVEPVDGGLYPRLREIFIEEKADGFRALSFFPDEASSVSALSERAERYPDTFVVSRKALAEILAAAIWEEISFLSAIAALVIPLLLYAFLRDARLTVIALLPLVSAVCAVLGVMPLLGRSPGAPVVVAGMVVVGLTIDYGIFMVFVSRFKAATGTRLAVTLSAVTTLIGAGALLLAHHPVMLSMGITLVTGVSTGYITALAVVPPLYRLWVE